MQEVEYIEQIKPVETGEKIVQYAMEAVKDPNIIKEIKKVVSGLIDENQPGLKLHGKVKTSEFVKIQEAYAVLNFVRHKIRSTRDPHRVELVYHPAVLFDQSRTTDLQKGKWAEDCDTIALLTLTFLLALGHNARLVLVGFPYPPGFSHVFCETRLDPFGWITVDPSMSDEKIKRLVKDIRIFQTFYPQ